MLLRRCLITACVGALGAFSVLHYVLHGNLWILGCDSSAYIAAGRAVARGLSPFTDSAALLPDTHLHITAYLYPPFLAVLFATVATLPYWMVWAGWLTTVACLSLLLVTVLAQRIGWLVATIGVLGFTPIWSGWWHGQINIVIALLLCAVLADVEAQRARAGVWIALGGLIKLTPFGLMFVLLYQRRWRACAVLVGATVLGVALTLPLVGWQTWREGVLTAVSLTVDHPSLRSLTAYVYRVDRGVAAVVTLLLLSITVYSMRALSPQLAVCAWMCLAQLAARITWYEGLVLLLPVFAVLWQRGGTWRVLVLLAWCALTITDGAHVPLIVMAVWICCCVPALRSDHLEGRCFQRLHSLRPLRMASDLMTGVLR